MDTIICAEFLGPFRNNDYQNMYDIQPRNVYIEFPNTIDNLNNNLQKVQKYINNKFTMLNLLNQTIEDEQPIEAGIFIITSIIVMDENMTKTLDTKFLGINVSNNKNRLDFLRFNNTPKIQEPKEINREMEMFYTPDGIGFN